jgi:hypothetical protein
MLSDIFTAVMTALGVRLSPSSVFWDIVIFVGIPAVAYSLIRGAVRLVRQGKVKVQPWHLITFGSLAAAVCIAAVLFGLAWQHYWPSGFGLSSQTLAALGPMTPPPQAPPEYVEAVRKFTRAELQSRVADFATALRTFETGYNNARTRELFADGEPLPKTDEQRLKRWQAQSAKSIERLAQGQTEFRARFLPEALALREELLRRQGVFSPFKQDRATRILDTGTLAGPNPLSDLAAYLEGLARSL